MNSALTRPQSLQELYKTYYSYADRFKFTDLMRNYIQSEEWKDKSQNAIWTMLSRISDDIGAVLTDGIVNYTRNVVDINTCKVPMLIEHAHMLSYGMDHLKNTYGFFPRRIRCLVDLFSVNPEYLVGNHKNHILSDAVVKEILIYVREHAGNSRYLDMDMIDRLMVDPHALVDARQWRNFVTSLFYVSLMDELSATYSTSSTSDSIPMAFNMLWWERRNQSEVLSNMETYRTWIDRYVGGEVEHPLNDDGKGLSGTIHSTVQSIMAQKGMSSRFNPYHAADWIWFDGLNPQNQLGKDELDLVQMVLDYHARNMYDYESQRFVDDPSTAYAYYSELEFCEYVKMVMYVENNLESFTMEGLTYEPSTNKFVQTGTGDGRCLRVARLFSEGGYVVEGKDGEVAINRQIVLDVARFLCGYSFLVNGLRENLKTIAQKHAMRGTGALLAHMVNDYLIKELPLVRDSLWRVQDSLPSSMKPLFGWETSSTFRNYANVRIVEYEDDNEYFNIGVDEEDPLLSENGTNPRYWEKLEGLSDGESIGGVFSKSDIRRFYQDVLGVGKLNPRKPDPYDSIQDFLVDIFRTGANPMKWIGGQDDGFANPIDDVSISTEKEYGYTKEQRMEVQSNAALRKEQERQFLEYSGNLDAPTVDAFDLVNSRLFYWKNTFHSSHMLHPFMYNLKVWNRLNNIIINGYRDYMDVDLVDALSSKSKFDDLFGEHGEGRCFWKHNVVDLSGYTSRYEAAVKDEHLDDGIPNSTSELTGYDGLFHPRAAMQFIQMMDGSQRYGIASSFFVDREREGLDQLRFNPESRRFMAHIHSIYWQLKEVVWTDGSSEESFYLRWFSHLNWSRDEYQKMAMQLWYWRDRILELATNEYPIGRYCLDLRGNSLILASTFKDGDQESNPYLIDLRMAQDEAMRRCGNHNSNVSFCTDPLRMPHELWIRWKSSPIAIPALDALYDQTTGDAQFDARYRNSSDAMVEMGQIDHTNNLLANDNFKVCLSQWNESYSASAWWKEHGLSRNRLPLFFDMQQSADVLVLSSWGKVKELDDDGIVVKDGFGEDAMIQCSGLNPIHVVCIERVGQDDGSSNGKKYNLSQYGEEDVLNDPFSQSHGWLFDTCHLCPADGSLLIPMYRFKCGDSDEQKMWARLLVVPAQSPKTLTHSTRQRMTVLNWSIDLNRKVDVDGKRENWLFGHPLRVCRNTRVAFSPYANSDGFNMLRFAFLGTFFKDGDTYKDTSVKVSSCGAKTRYEYDSQSTVDLALTKGRYFKENGSTAAESSESSLMYIDGDVASRRFNSYDALDKHVFVVEFPVSMDVDGVFNLSSSKVGCAGAFNIVSDAGCIPHFAYQSLVGYGKGDEGGTAFTWKNHHLGRKDSLAFEMLGLDDKGLAKAFDAMERMVVEDATDGCDTILCPARLVEDTYRIWCEAKTVNGTHFANEYKEFPNPKIEFVDSSRSVLVREWNAYEEAGRNVDALFEIDDHSYMLDSTMADTDRFRSLLNEYEVQVFRSEDGVILNEKRCILKPTPISDFMSGMVSDSDGFVECSLDAWQSAQISPDPSTGRMDVFNPTQTMFVGTPNPFGYGKDGRRIHSRAEELQYGNSIKGLDGIQLKVDLVVAEEGGARVWLNPIVRFRKNSIDMDGESTLLEQEHSRCATIPSGSILVVFSRRNVANIAKYHIMTKSSDLYLDGSLPKNGMNQFKFSDFKSTQTLELVEVQDGQWKSMDGQLEFNLDDVKDGGDGCPPYWVEVEKKDDGKVQKWYLEQEGIVSDHDEVAPPKGRHPICGSPEQNCHIGNMENEARHPIPMKGGFRWAHLKKDTPTSYLDYLYVRKRNGLSFKVDEESESFADALSRVPGFRIDEQTRNKLDDLNDVQIMQGCSTFIHQSEDPSKVAKAGTFNPYYASIVLEHGIERMESGDPSMLGRKQKMICLEDGSTMVELENSAQPTNLALVLEDGEMDGPTRIYATYARIEDGDGDFHYDIYLNPQNLLNSPFEYISTITEQPNVRIIRDSYIHLSGDRFKKVFDPSTGKTHNEIDPEKAASISKGGKLAIYGQLKTYQNDILVDVQTTRLFEYDVFNISDDKPKFLMVKRYGVSDGNVSQPPSFKWKVDLDFSDVMWTIDERRFRRDAMFQELNEDVMVVQPLKVGIGALVDGFKVEEISFDIASDAIDFNGVPELMGYHDQTRTLRDYTTRGMGKPHYDGWSDSHMALVERNPDTGNPRLTLKCGDGGFNFETIYLKWKLPKGCRVMDTLDRLNGCVFSSTAQNITFKGSGLDGRVVPDFNVTVGHVVARVHKKSKMYLGVEHSTHMRIGGYVLVGLEESLRKAWASDNPNPILDSTLGHVVDEDSLKEDVRKHRQSARKTNTARQKKKKDR